MIRGNDASNRDTSDAPLWFFTACADLVAAEGHDDFLSQSCNGRTVGQVLVDLARAIMAGTPNGIVMDAASGLVYSPAHFTWMDTNFPAGTPRQGYPIEIQALLGSLSGRRRHPAQTGFCEAWALCYGEQGREAALAWLSGSIQLINSHCVGHVPEIVDGDAPHRQRGCDAQAWGVSELLRVWKTLAY